MSGLTGVRSGRPTVWGGQVLHYDELAEQKISLQKTKIGYSACQWLERKPGRINLKRRPFDEVLVDIQTVVTVISGGGTGGRGGAAPSN